MVSNDEIKQRLLERRSGSPKKKFHEDQSLSSEELKQKFREKREQEIVENQQNQEKIEKIEKIEHPGYLICDTCGGYYELQPGESKDDFSDECECGGKIRYSKTLNDI